MLTSLVCELNTENRTETKKITKAFMVMYVRRTICIVRVYLVKPILAVRLLTSTL